MNLRFGTSGWSYNEWVGPFYDKKKGMFTRYSELFNTTEINSTFYAYPRASMIKGLYRNSPSEFIFAAKMPQEITHKKKLRLSKGVKDDLERFLNLMQPLAEKLGPILIQLPPSFNYEEDVDALEEFLQVLPSNYHFAVEFRHPSWMRPETWKILQNHNVAYTIVDEPLLPPEIKVTADFAYIRWHGHGSPTWYNYDYKTEELRSWVPRIKSLARKVKWVYGYFNNHFYWQVRKGDLKWGYPGAVKNVIELLDMLEAATEEQKKVLERITKWQETKPKVDKTKPIEEFIKTEEMGVINLLQRFMDNSRLRRAEKIKDEEIKIIEYSENYITAKIRKYTIKIDLKNKELKHDCADWNKGLNRKRMCKHLGKLFLTIPENRASSILKDILKQKEKWRFETILKEKKGDHAGEVI